MQNNQLEEGQYGTLYVVATPIGNLRDITIRALDVLREVNHIAAEDTRQARVLLQHYAIQKPIVSLHHFNERDRLENMLDYLYSGQSVALISDAGTPLISDPGFHFIHSAKMVGIHVVPIPGPCAAIAALSAAGLSTHCFLFMGFLPVKRAARCQMLERLQYEMCTTILYEAPHRLLSSLQMMSEVLGGERIIVVARELTKIYESIKLGTIDELLVYYTEHCDQRRGEIVILVAGAEASTKEVHNKSTEQVLNILLSELPLKQAVKLASRITGKHRNTLYEQALAKRENQ